jgi:hypothetical protein
MAIEVNSGAWTGDGDKQGGGATGPTAPQVCGEFHGKEKMEHAIMRLEGTVFDRSQISVRVPGREDHGAYSGRETPVQEDDARNLRTMLTSTAAAGTAMLAAGVVVATGGAALPAVAAAAAAGGATVAAGEAAGAAATPAGGTEQQAAADHGGVIVMVSADTPEKQARAEEILREAGADRVWRQDGV